jgi:hypothetical protein
MTPIWEEGSAGARYMQTVFEPSKRQSLTILDGSSSSSPGYLMGTVGSTMNPAWKCHMGRKVDGIPEEGSVPSSFPDLRGTASVAAFVSASHASTTSNSTLPLHIHSLPCSRHSQPNSHRRVAHVAHAAYPVMPISAACWSDLSQLRHVANAAN